MLMTKLVGTLMVNLTLIAYVAEDEVCKEVSVAVDDTETRIVFVDHQHGEMSVSRHMTLHC